MAKNPVNDNGLENNVPKAILAWYRCECEIVRLIKKQEQHAEDIKLELDSAREFDYTEEEIKKLIGTVVIPSFYLIDE